MHSLQGKVNYKRNVVLFGLSYNGFCLLFSSLHQGYENPFDNGQVNLINVSLSILTIKEIIKDL